MKFEHRALLFSLGLIFIILTSCGEAAYSFRSYEVKFDLSDSLAKQLIKVDVINKGEKPLKKLNFRFTSKPKEVEINWGRPSILKAGKGWLLRIDFEKPLATGESKSLTISLSINGMTKRFDGRKIFRYILTSKVNISIFSLEVIYPERANIAIEKGSELLSPKAKLIPLAGGKRIKTLWKSKLAEGETFTAFAVYKPAEERFSSILVVLLLASIFISAVALFFYLKARREKKVIKATLGEDEKLIFDLIEEKGTLLQENLTELTHFSKTKVSKLVRRLEQKKLIQKEPYKKTNKLKISKRIR